MNTSVSVLHADTQALLLCPVCLRKLELALKFDIQQRYKGLDGFLTLHTDACGRRERNRLSWQSSQAGADENECPVINDRNKIRKVIDFITQH